MATHDVRITVNGEPQEAAVESRLLLVHWLRDVLRLTGTHIGCDTTHCGACTVLLDGEPVKSCTVLAVQANGREVMTVEGLEQDGSLHPLQEGFQEEHGAAMRLLHAGHADDRVRPARADPESERGRDPAGDFREPVSLHRLREHRQVDRIRGRQAALGEKPWHPRRLRKCVAWATR